MYLDEGAVEQPEPGRALDLGLSYQLPGPTPGKPAGPMHPLLLSMPPTKQEKPVLNQWGYFFLGTYDFWSKKRLKKS